VLTARQMLEPSAMPELSLGRELFLGLGRLRLGLLGDLSHGRSHSRFGLLGELGPGRPGFLGLSGGPGRPHGLGWLGLVVQPFDQGRDRRRGLSLAHGPVPARVRRPIVGSLRLGGGRGGGQAQGERNSLHRTNPRDPNPHTRIRVVARGCSWLQPRQLIVVPSTLDAPPGKNLATSQRILVGEIPMRSGHSRASRLNHEKIQSIARREPPRGASERSR
jgi:hypothetical protein